MKLFFFTCLILAFASCKLMPKDEPIRDNRRLSRLFEDYYEERMKLFPIEATQRGDSRYNDLLPVDFTESYAVKLQAFYNDFVTRLSAFNRDHLNENDKVSYDIFKREMEINLEALSLKYNLTTLFGPNMD